MIAAGAPLALFMAALWQPRPGSPSTPFLGLAALSFVFAVAWVGWITPAANQEFRERTYALHGGQGILAKGQAELSLPELLSPRNERTRAARIQISHRLGLAVWCPLMILLAGQLQPMRRFYRWVVTPLPLSAVGFILDASWRTGVVDRFAAPWGFPAGALAAAIAIGLARPPRRSGSRYSET
jgi:hypothetical protein